MAPIQTNFNKYQQAGFVGTISRPMENVIWDDKGKAAVELTPGDGVLFDRTNKNWKLPTTDAEELQVTRIVGMDVATVQSTVSGGDNSDQGVVFAAGTMVRLLAKGVMWVQLTNAAVVKGDQLQYDRATGFWKRYNPSAGTIADFRTKLFIAESDGAANGLVECRADAQIKF